MLAVTGILIYLDDCIAKAFKNAKSNLTICFFSGNYRNEILGSESKRI